MKKEDVGFGRRRFDVNVAVSERAGCCEGAVGVRESHDECLVSRIENWVRN